MRAAGFAAIAALALASTGCGNFLSFQAEASDACVTVTGIHIPGADEAPVAHTTLPSVTITQDFAVPVDQTGLPLDSARLKFVSFTLSPETASYDFGFVSQAQLSAVSAGGSLLLGSWQPGGTSASEIQMQPSTQPDVTAYVSGGELELEGTLTGTMPAHGFDADATICFDVTLTQASDSSPSTKVP